MKAKFTTAALLSSLGLAFFFTSDAFAATHVFPVIGSSSFSNDFNAPRSDGPHNAIDIIASKHRPIVSATDGTITYVAYPQPSWGYMVRIVSTGGYTYDYIHINNDTPGSDDGKGGAMNAYAAGIREGNPIKKGQLIGWVGDSGNAENTVSHLHYEVRDRNNKPYNPYNDLKNATKISTPTKRAIPSNEAIPYGEKTIALNVALGDLDGDGKVETVVGSGRKESPRIMIYHSSMMRLANFPVYNTNYLEGIDVSTGDVDGDNEDEIVASARVAEGSRVWVYDYEGGVVTEIAEFATQIGARSGSRVTTGDVDGDGIDEIITGSGLGQGAQVEVFSLSGAKIKSFNAGYEAGYSGGIDVAAGDVTGSNRDEIVVSRLGAGSPLVKVFDNTSNLQINSFYAHGGSHKTGVRVAVGNAFTVSPKEEIVTLPNGGNPKLKTFNAEGTTLREEYFIEEWWRGYYDIAVSDGVYRPVTGYNRRASVHF